MATQNIPTEVSSGGGGGGATLAAYASTPSSPSAGQELVCTDSPLRRIYNGSAWLDSLPGFGPPVAAMPITGWTQVGTAPTALVAAGGLRSIQPGAAIGGYERAAPATSWRSRSLFRIATRDTTPDIAIGLYLEETATSEALGMQVNVATASQVLYTVDRPNGATSATGQSIVLTGSPAFLQTAPFWLEAEYNAANAGSEIAFRWSVDGVNFLTFATYNVATYFTSAPDKTVTAFDPGGSTTTVYTQFLYTETPL